MFPNSLNRGEKVLLDSSTCQLDPILFHSCTVIVWTFLCLLGVCPHWGCLQWHLLQLIPFNVSLAYLFCSGHLLGGRKGGHVNCDHNYFILFWISHHTSSDGTPKPNHPSPPPTAQPNNFPFQFWVAFGLSYMHHYVTYLPLCGSVVISLWF